MSERMERQTGESSSSAVKVSKLVKRYGDMLAPARPRRLTAFSHC